MWNFVTLARLFRGNICSFEKLSVPCLFLSTQKLIMSVSWFFVEIGKNDLMDKHSRKLQAAQTDSLKNSGTRVFYF